jgi:Spy/CpxP family protein refolding chaperone
MNSTNKKGKEAADKIHFRKENAMKTRTIKKRNISVATAILLAAGLLIILTGIFPRPLMAKARGWFGPPRSADEIVQILTDRLDLTEEQVKAIRPIVTEKKQKISEIRNEIGTDRRAGRAEIRKLRWDTEMKLGEILTAEQIDRYLELKQEQREKKYRGTFRGAKMGGGLNKTPEQVIERLRSRLDLTDEQAVDIGPIIQESMEKKRAIFDRYRDENIKARESIRNEMQNIGDETHAQLSTILTDEQMEELNAIQEEKRARMDKRFNRSGPMGF